MTGCRCVWVEGGGRELNRQAECCFEMFVFNALLFQGAGLPVSERLMPCPRGCHSCSNEPNHEGEGRERDERKRGDHSLNSSPLLCSAGHAQHHGRGAWNRNAVATEVEATHDRAREWRARGCTSSTHRPRCTDCSALLLLLPTCRPTSIPWLLDYALLETRAGRRFSAPGPHDATRRRNGEEGSSLPFAENDGSTPLTEIRPVATSTGQ